MLAIITDGGGDIVKDIDRIEKLLKESREKFVTDSDNWAKIFAEYLTKNGVLSLPFDIENGVPVVYRITDENVIAEDVKLVEIGFEKTSDGYMPIIYDVLVEDGSVSVSNKVHIKKEDAIKELKRHQKPYRKMLVKCKVCGTRFTTESINLKIGRHPGTKYEIPFYLAQCKECQTLREVVSVNIIDTKG